MASQNVNFTTSNDTGENNAGSISPYENGERAVAAVFNRPPEALRVRTETLRTSVEGLQYLGDADRAMVISGGGDITWNVSGNKRVVITQDLVIRPFLAPQSCTVAKYAVGPVLLQTRADSSWAGSSTPTVPRAYSGANKISVMITGSDGAGAVTVTLPTEANPRDNIVINIDTNPVSGTTALQLVTAFNSVADITGDTGLGVLASVDAADENVILAAVSPSVLTAAPVYMSGALDAEEHIISPSGLNSFFNADAGANLMEDGDTIALWYPELVMPDGGGRRQSINAPPELAGGRDGAAADAVLFNVRRFPERALGALPVCTVADGKLVFLTGERLEPGSSGVLGGATADNVTYAGSSPEAWADGTYLPASSVETALDTIVEVLGDATGGTLVGFDGHTNLTAPSVSGAIKELDAEKAGLFLPNVFTKTNRFEADAGTGVEIRPVNGPGLIIEAVDAEGAAEMTAGVGAQEGLIVKFKTPNTTDGTAIEATGGAAGGIGVEAWGGTSTGTGASNDGTGVGVIGHGGTGEPGVFGPTSAPIIAVRGGSGVEGYGGNYGGAGVKAQGGSDGVTGGHGVETVGGNGDNVGGSGVHGTGGTGTSTGGAGVMGVGGEPNGTGVLGSGAVSGGIGVWGLGSADLPGVKGTSSTAVGVEGNGDTYGVSGQGQTAGVRGIGPAVGVLGRSVIGVRGVGDTETDKGGEFVGGNGAFDPDFEIYSGPSGVGLTAQGGSGDSGAAGVVASGGTGNAGNGGNGVIATGGYGGIRPQFGSNGVNATGETGGAGVLSQGGSQFPQGEDHTQDNFATCAGVVAYGGVADARAIVGFGGNGANVAATGETLTGVGVLGLGNGNAQGVVGFGGPTGGAGVYGRAYGTNDVGVVGRGGTAGSGVAGYATGAAAPGVYGEGVSEGVRGYSETGTAVIGFSQNGRAGHFKLLPGAGFETVLVEHNPAYSNGAAVKVTAGGISFQAPSGQPDVFDSTAAVMQWLRFAVTAKGSNPTAGLLKQAARSGSTSIALAQYELAWLPNAASSGKTYISIKFPTVITGKPVYVRVYRAYSDSPYRPQVLPAGFGADQDRTLHLFVDRNGLIEPEVNENFNSDPAVVIEVSVVG